jgi:hypothetical protein
MVDVITIKIRLDLSPEDQARLDYLIELEKKRKEAEPVATIHSTTYVDPCRVKAWSEDFRNSQKWHLNFTSRVLTPLEREMEERASPQD